MEALTGYDPDGWDESIWLLHTMFEHPDLPDTTSHHQARAASLETGEEQSLIIAGMNLDEVTTDTGVPLGYVDDPSTEPVLPRCSRFWRASPAAR
jgi:hypothetical protein